MNERAKETSFFAVCLTLLYGKRNENSLSGFDDVQNEIYFSSFCFCFENICKQVEV
jgi:hypothetical protein